MASVHTNSWDGRTITLEVYEESWSIETNTSVVRWTLRSGTSSTYHNVYQITAWVNGTDDAHKVYGPKTATWESRAFPCKDGSVTGTITVQHNNDGTASPVPFRLRGSVRNNNPQNYDGSIDLTTIPRYASCSQSLSDTNENDMTINWSSDSTIDHVWYSIDNGANWTDVGAVWTNQGTYVIYNLNANTTYNIKTRVRRADSQLTTDSAVAGWTTLAYPYISGLGATSLTIGNNQTLYLYNPKGRQITVYMKKDGYDGNQIFSQTITNNSNTPFTFTPNASTMYNLIPNSRSANCVYYVVYGNNRSGTANGNFVVNENDNRPSISSFTTNDNNSTYSLTNDHSKIVLNATNMSLTINGSGQNGASISGISVNNTALTVSNNSGTYTLNKPPSATFNVVLTDSRGIQTNTNITLQNYVAYFEPILNTNAVRNQPTDGILNLSGNGSFYNGSFGAENNTLDVQYTVTEQGTGTVLETGYMSLTPSGNDFTLQDLQVSNANYQKQYVVSFNAIDKLNTITKNIPIPKGQPVYWWNGEKFVVIEDFEVKGDTTTSGNVEINGNTSNPLIINTPGESSIRFSSGGNGKFVAGYGPAGFDGYGIYAWDTSKNVFTTDNNGNTTIEGNVVIKKNMIFKPDTLQAVDLNEVGTIYPSSQEIALHNTGNGNIANAPNTNEVAILKTYSWGGNGDWAIQEWHGLSYGGETERTYRRMHTPTGWGAWENIGGFIIQNYWGGSELERWVNNNGSYDQNFASWGVAMRIGNPNDTFYSWVLIGNYQTYNRSMAINSYDGQNWSGWRFIKNE